jgi:hypothetical protein
MSEIPPSQHGTGPGEQPDGSADPFDPFTVERLLADPGAAGTEDERALADLLGALRAPAAPAELVVPERVLAAFDAHADAVASGAGSTDDALPSPRRKSMISTALAAKGVVAAAALAVATAGTAAAAFTGHLPGALQAAAHRAVGAPDADHGTGHGKAADHRPDGTPTGKPTPSVRPTGSAVGPDATGAAAAGLCTAFGKGGLATTSTAYRNLAQAAGGPDAIPAFCATVAEHGKSSTGTHAPSGHPTGKPTDKPGGKPTDKPTGKPTDKPAPGTGAPTDKPTGHPTGKPTR